MIMEANSISIPYTKVKFQVGTRFYMGAQTVMWRVLEINQEEQTAIVIADKEICVKQYNEKSESVTWENCTLRKWLNEDYFEKTFNDLEKEAILECEIKNPDNPAYNTKGGNDTKDKIWLLNLEEVDCWFKDDNDRAIDRTWWLRSPGYNSYFAAEVNYGRVNQSGNAVTYGGDRYGVRPAFKINLKSEFFQSLIVESEPDNFYFNIPMVYINGTKEVSAYPYATNIEIPEGITEIAPECFAGMKDLRSVKFPSTLKKVGKKAFSDCTSLTTISGMNGAISYGKDPFEYCWNLVYTPELFHNTGKLCDSFAEHMENCGSEELAWCIMYQKGAIWDKAINRKLTAQNADEILAHITDHVAAIKKTPKKMADAGKRFIITNILLLSRERIVAFCEVVRSRKLAMIAEDIESDPEVKSILDSGITIDHVRVRPNGNIWYGNIESPIAVGSTFYMDNERTVWRILDIDKEEQTAIVIADQEVCEKEYNSEYVAVTWENCTLRKWLNKDYFEKTFNDLEKEAILECEIKNPDNPQYKTKGGNDTKDRIWLLSLEEVEKWFKDDNNRANGSWWWLRSPGDTQFDAAFVRGNGSVDISGVIVSLYYGICPAFKINLKSDFFQSIIHESENGEAVISNPEMIIRAGKVLAINRLVESVEIPAYANTIEAGCCDNSTALKSITWASDTMTIEEGAFQNCPNLRLPAGFYNGDKLPDERFAEYLPTDVSVLANVLLKASKRSCYRYIAIKRLTKENADAVAEELFRRDSEKKPIGRIEDVVRFALAFAPVLNDDNLRKLSEKILHEYEMGQYLKKELERRRTGKAYVQKPMKCLFDISWKVLDADPFIFGDLSLYEVLTAVWDYYIQYHEGYANTSAYKKTVTDGYKKDPKADQAAMGMNHKSLMEVLRLWGYEDASWLAPYAAFANEQELAELLKDMKMWETEKYKREQIVRVRGAILLNDTNDAMRYVDSLGLLGRYAELRGLSEDDVRDNMMSDMGLDERGQIRWTLGEKTYTATLNKDLTVTLCDETGKEMRSISKKGVNPEAYAIVDKAFKDLKKDIKPTVKLRNAKVFADFLSGRTRNGSDWKKAYLKNPLLRILAQIIVWEQDGQTFLLHEDGKAYDVNNGEYTITGAAIKVAHPMEMGSELTEEWQNYFTDHQIKQPFEQIWEPVADVSLVKHGRYDGCTVPLHALMNKEKHGIIMEGRSQITLKDCRADLQLIEGHHDWYNNEFEVKNFSFKNYTRQVNHIVVHLDKATVAGRIKKDDVTVVQWLDRFTMAQIMEFIDLAAENKATNVSALLLQYKEEHFGGFDPMDEFTLDLL